MAPVTATGIRRYTGMVSEAQVNGLPHVPGTFPDLATDIVTYSGVAVNVTEPTETFAFTAVAPVRHVASNVQIDPLRPGEFCDIFVTPAGVILQAVETIIFGDCAP